MQSIERYGVIALLFLVVTVVAVLMWDTEDNPTPAREAQAATASRPLPVETPRSGPVTRESLTRPRAVEPPAVRTTWDDGALEELRPRVDPPAVVQAEPLHDPLVLEARKPERSAPSPSEPRTERATQAETSRNAPAKSAPATDRSKDARLYVVRPGDTLGEIALESLGSSKRWPEIVALNPGLDPQRMQVGARLVLPPEALATPARPSSPAKAATGSSAVADAPTYRVAKGDSLWKIAERVLGDGERWREIVAANPGLDPDRIAVGARLRLPSGAEVPKRDAGDGARVAQASRPSTPARKGRVQ